MSQRGLFLNQIAQRYAAALFDLAREQNMLDPVAQDLQRLVGLVDSNEEFRRFVGSAVVSREQSGKVMTAVLARMGVSELSRKFVMLLAEKRRLFVLPAVATAYRALFAELRGEMSAEVISAQPLKDGQITTLKGALRDAYKREVLLDTKVDRNLIGGFILKARSRQLDFSLRSKLKALEVALKGA